MSHHLDYCLPLVLSYASCAKKLHSLGGQLGIFQCLTCYAQHATTRRSANITAVAAYVHILNYLHIRVSLTLTRTPIAHECMRLYPLKPLRVVELSSLADAFSYFIYYACRLFLVIEFPIALSLVFRLVNKVSGEQPTCHLTRVARDCPPTHTAPHRGIQHIAMALHFTLRDLPLHAKGSMWHLGSGSETGDAASSSTMVAVPQC